MDPIIELYIDLQSTYQSYGEELYHLLTKKLSENGIRFHKLEWRLKTPLSVEEKIKRKPYRIETLSDISDLIGFRIICNWEDEIPSIISFIEANFKYISYRSGIKMDPKFNICNYKSVFFTLVLKEDDLKLLQFVKDDRLRFEVQIMSLIQYAGAELERHLVFKNQIAIPFSARKRLKNVSMLLGLAETEIMISRNEIYDNEKKLYTLYKKIIKELPDDTPLNMASVMSFVISNDFIQTIDKRLKEYMFYDYKEEFLLLDFHLEQANYLGIHTLKELCTLLFESQKNIINFDSILLRNTNKNEESIKSYYYLGVSIDILCSYLLAKRNDLEFTIAYYLKFWNDMTEDDAKISFSKFTVAYRSSEIEMRNKDYIV